MNGKEKIQGMIAQLQITLSELEYKEHHDNVLKECNKYRDNDFNNQKVKKLFYEIENSRLPKRCLITESLRNVGRQAFLLSNDIKEEWK